MRHFSLVSRPPYKNELVYDFGISLISKKRLHYLRLATNLLFYHLLSQVKISNENDNLPYFLQNIYTVNITGTTAQPGESLLVLRAWDRDIKGDLGLRFTIVEGNEEGYFEVDGKDIKLVRRYGIL